MMRMAGVCALVCFSSVGMAAELDVYLLAGESNATGRAPVTELTDGIYATVDESILYAAREIDWSDGTVRQDIPLGGLRPTNGTVGPAVSLGRALGENVALLSLTSGGSGTNDWANSGQIQPHWFSFIDAQMSNLRDLGHVPTIKGMFYVMGDWIDTPIYLSRNNETMDAIRNHVGQPDLPIYVARLHEDLQEWPHFDYSRGNLHRMATNAALASEGIVTLTSSINDLQTRDGIHYTADAYVELGKRLATISVPEPTQYLTFVLLACVVFVHKRRRDESLN